MIIINILVIGNGFDIAHKLPTRYVDFLNFLRNWENNSIKYDNYYDDKYLKSSNSYRDKVYKKCKNNMWYQYFIKVRAGMSNNKDWIDFEEEIGNRLKRLTENQSKEWKKSLDDFTNCLNFYFYDYINLKPVEVRLPDVYNNEFDYVMSFNYTDTFERLYGNIYAASDSIKYSYVHGKADKYSELVLGSDNLLNINMLEDKLYNLKVPFEKIFQRSEKKTDKSYSTWFANENVSKQFDLHIIGHSLGMTDKSLLIGLMLHPKSRIIVYYHSHDCKKSLISNLIRMLGVDNYNLKSPKILFKLQKEPVILKEKDQQLEKLFTCLEIDIEEFSKLISEAEHISEDNGYTYSLVKRFKRKYSEIYTNNSYNNVDISSISSANYNMEKIKYLEKLCTGDVKYDYDELSKINLSKARVCEIDDFVYHKDIAVQIRWENIKNILNI